jgi:hypothetical protein
MIEFATQRNFDRHDMYLRTMWFVIVDEGVQGSIALQCPNTQDGGWTLESLGFSKHLPPHGHKPLNPIVLSKIWVTHKTCEQ